MNNSAENLSGEVTALWECNARAESGAQSVHVKAGSRAVQTNSFASFIAFFFFYLLEDTKNGKRQETQRKEGQNESRGLGKGLLWGLKIQNKLAWIIESKWRVCGNSVCVPLLRVLIQTSAKLVENLMLISCILDQAFGRQKSYFDTG